MVQIEKIEIYYFRSIYKIMIKNLKDLSVFSGKNDTGKSNILKALNLFFNNETDWKTQIDFKNDFSKKRLNEVRKDTIKGKQFIRIKVYFKRGGKSVKSLPEKFYVTRTWYRNSLVPETKSSIEKQYKDGKIATKSLGRAQASLQGYLNRIRFEYIPAIKDREFFLYSLGLLQDTILKNRQDDGVEKAVKNLNKTVEVGTNELNQEFCSVCNVQTDIKLPTDLASLFRAFSVVTELDEDMISLSKRGDGIQTRFIPSLLYHISQKSKLTYIWGFEEPENCLEHSLSSNLAKTMMSEYSKANQILLTSHSSAFIALEGNNISKFRVFAVDKETKVNQMYPEKDILLTEYHMLQDELGLLALSEEQEKIFLERKEEYELAIQNKKILEKKINKYEQPVLLTEGKTDPIILKIAWGKLYPEIQCPFEIVSCNTNPDHENEAAGASMLKIAIESIRPDSQITIALFDYDIEGIKSFEKLNKNFNKKNNNLKVHKNKRAAALCIPRVSKRKKYFDAKNACIEFLFENDYLEQKTEDGKGLELSYPMAETRIGSEVIATNEIRKDEYRTITKNKKLFAEKIVPTFEKEAFINFEKLFEEIQKILEDT